MGGSQDDQATSIYITSDKGIITSGYSYSNDGLLGHNNGWQDGWLIKTNKDGHIEWQKNFGGSGADVIESVKEVHGGFIISGWSDGNDINFLESKGLEDGFIAKVNYAGHLLWIKSFGGNSMDKLFDIELDSDGNIYATGYSMSNDLALSNGSPKGLLDIWVIKLSPNGNLIWQNTFGGSDDDFAYDMIISPTDKIFIAGNSESDNGEVGSNNGDWDSWLLEINKSGQLVNSHHHGYSGQEEMNKLVIYGKELYVLGSSNSSNRPDQHGSRDGWVLKYDMSTNLVEEYSIGSYGHDIIHSAVSTSKGLYISGESKHNENTDGWIIQMNSNGSVENSQLIGGTEYDVIKDITATDNTIYLAGVSFSDDGDISQNFGQSDLLIAKLGGTSENDASAIQLYPNPASDQLNIVLDQVGIETITVHNSIGQIVYSAVANDFFQEQIDVSNWTSGQYTLEVLTNNEIRRVSFIKR